ncbi:gas vesicle protein [Streptomyces sp. NPDC055709]
MRTGATAGPADADPLPQRQVALIDLLDRLLSGGVVLTGDVVLSIADIDLVRVSLRALIVSVRSAQGDHDRDRGHDGH